MAEKAGHKKYMRMKRMEWIDEGKPRPAGLDDDNDSLFGEPSNQPEERAAAIFPSRIAPIFQSQVGEKAQTPTGDDVPDDDEDLYGATPAPPKRTEPTSASLFGSGAASKEPASTSLFGNGGDPDDDDLDALMAEEEAQRTKPTNQNTSLFGNGSAKPIQVQNNEPDEDDLDALMAEAEAEVQQKPANPSSDATPKPAPAAAVDNEEDDLDALMAETEHDVQSKEPRNESSAKPKEAGDEMKDAADADDEAAMAEMDGLW